MLTYANVCCGGCVLRGRGIYISPHTTICIYIPSLLLYVYIFPHTTVDICIVVVWRVRGARSRYIYIIYIRGIYYIYTSAYIYIPSLLLCVYICPHTTTICTYIPSYYCVYMYAVCICMPSYHYMYIYA